MMTRPGLAPLVIFAPIQAYAGDLPIAGPIHGLRVDKDRSQASTIDSPISSADRRGSRLAVVFRFRLTEQEGPELRGLLG